MYASWDAIFPGRRAARCAARCAPTHPAPAPGQKYRVRSAPQGPDQEYSATISTSSSVTVPSTIRNERNWKGPASSVSAVETST